MCATSWARIALMRNLIARYLLKLIKLMNNEISFLDFFLYSTFSFYKVTFKKLRALEILLLQELNSAFFSQ